MFTMFTSSRGTAWHPSSNSSAPLAWAISAARLGVEDRAQDVGYVGESYNTMLLGQHRFRRIEIDLAVGRQRHRVDFEPGELPRDDVAVVLELRQQDAVAAVFRQAWATRLIASVAPRVKTSSSGWPPIRFDAAARASS